MRADFGLRGLLAAALLAAAASTAVAAADPRAADEAFDAGDTARALTLYDEVLAERPDDVHALLNSGKLLSWDKKYDGALKRYDHALTIEPRNVDVLLERGKVLLWSRRYDEAVVAFDRVLAINPKEPWALCGTAQAYAWRGRSREARPYYERALAASPGMKEAMLGLAYIELGDGDTTRALKLTESLEKAAPTDPEVQDLAKQVRRARAPWIQVGWDGAEDSDENGMNTYRVEGGLGLPAWLDLRLGYAHSDLHGAVPGDPHADGSADVLSGTLGWQPHPSQRAELRAGAARLGDSAGDTRTTGVGALSYRFPIASWTATATIARDPFLYSPQILDNRIDITSLTFGASGLAAARVRVEANAGYGHFTDGNDRLSADAGAWYVFGWPKQTLLAGGSVRGLRFSEDVDHGYFDPNHLIAVVSSARSYGSIDGSSWWYEGAVEAGVQWFEHNGAAASHEPLWSLSGLVSKPLPHGLTLQFFAAFGNSSTASGPGFTSRSGGARLRYSFGG